MDIKDRVDISHICSQDALIRIDNVVNNIGQNIVNQIEKLKQ